MNWDQFKDPLPYLADFVLAIYQNFTEFHFHLGQNFIATGVKSYW